MDLFEAVLWDMDGTLLDSERQHYQAWRDVLAARDVDYTYEEFRTAFGRTNQAVLTALFPDITVAELTAISREKERQYRRLLAQAGVQLLAGVHAWLDDLHGAGVVQILSSSAPMANITAAMHLLDIADYFGALMSGAHLPRSKPDPLLFLNSAAACAVEPTRCLVIEDSVHGVEAARRAGMACVVVGALAADPALSSLLAAVPGPDCLPLPSLGSMRWEQVQAHWHR